jgi:site-specific recombinase XerD
VEVKAILAQPNRSTIEGQSDHALFSFLYNTGARIQEALDVCPRAIRFDSPTCVRLYGKGRKERLSPLWPETVLLLRSQLMRQPRAGDEPIFVVNRYGVPLDASGVRFKLAQYVEAAAKITPSLTSKHVTPHSFRHATAVHLVAAGVDVHGDPKLARPCQPRHHKPLRSGKSGNKAPCVGTPRNPVRIGKATVVET